MPASWPHLHVEFKGPTPGGNHPPGTTRIDSDGAEVWLLDGDRIDVQRDPLVVSFMTRQPVPALAVLHPFLGLPASIASRWLGRISLHGGAFAYADRAWALIGEQGSGKSSTLGYLLNEGHPVLSDDILIISGTTVFSGPRSIDLREDAAGLGGEPLGFVGNRARWRVRAPDCPPSLQLGGIVRLAWGDRIRMKPLQAKDRLQGLVDSTVLRPGARQAEQLLALAAIPGWECTRPENLGELQEVAARLLDSLAGSA